MNKFEMPKLSEKIRVRVVDRFDLGFIAEDLDGNKYQLRAPEMNELFLKYDRNNDLESAMGRAFEAYIFEDFRGRISQLTENELKVREEENVPRVKAFLEKIKSSQKCDTDRTFQYIELADNWKSLIKDYLLSNGVKDRNHFIESDFCTDYRVLVEGKSGEKISTPRAIVLEDVHSKEFCVCNLTFGYKIYSSDKFTHTKTGSSKT